MNQHAKHYTHSGELGSSLLLAPIGGLIAAAVLAVAYAYISVYSPIAGWISILFVLGFGFGQGFTVGQIGYLAKCRNSGLLTIVGLVTGVVALYSQDCQPVRPAPQSADLESHGPSPRQETPTG